MKSIITLIICMFTITLAFAQQVFKLDSTLVQNWDASTDEWIDNLKNHYYYDNGGDLATREYQFLFENDSWDSISRTTNTYTDDNLDQAILESFDGTQWFFTNRCDFVYNADNEVTLKDNFIYTGSWLNNTRNENTYDAGTGSITEELYKTLDFITSQLLNERRNLFTYNVDDLLDQKISQIWLSTIWENQTREDHFYLANDLTDYIDHFNWLGASWSTVAERTVFTYDSDDLVVEVLTQVPGSSSLENDSRILNTYDAAPNLIQVIGQNWNGSSWDNESNLIQNYDANNNIEEQITQIWDIPNNEWLNQVRLISYWSLAEPLSTLENQKPLQFTLYPNPANNIFYINSELPIHKVDLLDVNGSLINTYVDDAITQINTSRLTSGFYFVTITSGSNKITKKLIIK